MASGPVLTLSAEYRREQDRLTIINSLGATNVREVHQRKVKAKAPNTCEWFLSNPTFVAWESSSSQEASERFLFISGKSGCGKSILAASIIETFKQQKKETMYFYFSGLETSRQDADSLVRWFLLDVLPSTTDETVQMIKLLFAKGNPTSSELRRALSIIMATLPTPLYLVIDGIDEVQGQVGDLFVQLRGIIDKSPLTKVILIGRPHAFERQASAYWIRISNELLQADIRTFIATETQRSALLQQPNIHERVIKELLEKADGMFLWARLSINELCGAYSQDDVKQILKRLPLGMENAFNRILQEIVTSSGETEIQRAKYILTILVVSARALELRELQHACAVATQMNQDEFEREPLDAYKGPDPATMFLRSCRGLISIENGIVGLVHLTAREYLVRPAVQWDSRISILRVDAAAAHGFLANVCLETITGSGFEWFRQREGLFIPQSLEYPPLFSYAIKFMAYHFNRWEDTDPVTAARIESFFVTHGISWVELLVVSCFAAGQNTVTTREFLDIAAWLTDDPIDGRKKMSMLIEQVKQKCEEYDGNHWQSQRLHLLGNVFRFVAEVDLTASRRNMSPSQGNTTFARRSPITMVQEDLSQVVHLLAEHASLSLPKQGDLVTKLGKLFRKGQAKNLLSPFDLLFRLFKSKINNFPTILLFGFGELSRSLQRPHNALEIFNTVLSRLGDDEEELKYKVWELIGRAYSSLKDYERAYHAHHTAWTGRRNMFGPKHKDIASSAHLMGISLYRQKNYAEAEAHMRQSLSMEMELFGLKHKETALSMYWLGLAILRQTRYPEAEVCFQQSSSMMVAAYGKQHRFTAASIENVGHSLFCQGKFVQAEFHLRRAAAIHVAADTPHQETARCLSALGQTLYEQKKFMQAEEQFRRSRKLMAQDGLDLGDRKAQLTSLLLAQTLCHQGKFANAESVLRSSFAISPRNMKADGLEFAALLWLARVLHYQQKNCEADSILNALLPPRGQKGNFYHEYALTIVFFLGRIFNAQERYAEAESILRQVVVEEYRSMNGSATTCSTAVSETFQERVSYEHDIDAELAEEMDHGSEAAEEEQEKFGGTQNDEGGSDIATESEAEADHGKDSGFSEIWDHCNIHHIFKEYDTTGRHLERQGKVAEAEEVYQLLKLVGWTSSRSGN